MKQFVADLRRGTSGRASRKICLQTTSVHLMQYIYPHASVKCCPETSPLTAAAAAAAAAAAPAADTAHTADSTAAPDARGAVAAPPAAPPASLALCSRCTCSRGCFSSGYRTSLMTILEQKCDVTR